METCGSKYVKTGPVGEIGEIHGKIHKKDREMYRKWMEMLLENNGQMWRNNHWESFLLVNSNDITITGCPSDPMGIQATW